MCSPTSTQNFQISHRNDVASSEELSLVESSSGCIVRGPLGGTRGDVDKTALVETRELHREGDNGFLIVSKFCAGFRAHSLDLLLIEPVDEDPEIGGDAVLAEVHVGQGALGVHRLAGEHFPVLEAAQNLLHRGLSTRLENGGALGVLLFQVFESSLHEVLNVNSPSLLVEAGGGQTVSEDDVGTGNSVIIG